MFSPVHFIQKEHLNLLQETVLIPGLIIVLARYIRDYKLGDYYERKEINKNAKEMIEYDSQ